MNIIEVFNERRKIRKSKNVEEINKGNKKVANDLINGKIVNSELKRRIELNEAIRTKYFGSYDYYKIDSCDLDKNIIDRIKQLVILFENEIGKNFSDADMLEILNNSMSYGLFGIWLLDNRLNGNELSLNEKLKQFFKETTDEDILNLYKISLNTNGFDNNKIRIRN